MPVAFELSMDDLLAVPLISKNGVKGKVLTLSRLLDDRSEKSVIFDGGREVVVRSKHLHLRPDGTYFLDLIIDQASTSQVPIVRSSDAVIPVIQEEAYVTKRTVETGRVRVRKTVSQEQVTIDEPILYEEYDVQRVAINRVVESTSPPRVEGDTTIISLYEEEAVTIKRLVLREEVHLTKKQRIEHSPRTVTLRKENVEVERLPPQAK